MGDRDWRLAVDIGGTFTDLVLLDASSGAVVVDKTLTTPGRLVDGVTQGVAKAGTRLAQAGLFLHGSTIAINTMLERTGAKVLVLMEGRDSAGKGGVKAKSVKAKKGGQKAAKQVAPAKRKAVKAKASAKTKAPAKKSKAPKRGTAKAPKRGTAKQAARKASAPRASAKKAARRSGKARAKK